MDYYQPWKPDNKRRGAIFYHMEPVNACGIQHEQRQPAGPVPIPSSSSNSSGASPRSDDATDEGPISKRTRQNREKSQRYHFRIKTQRQILAALHAELSEEATKMMDAGPISEELREALAHQRVSETVLPMTRDVDNERKRKNKVMHRQRELERLESLSLVAACLLSHRTQNQPVSVDFQIDATNLVEEHIRWTFVRIFCSWHREWDELLLAIRRTRDEIMYIKGDPLSRLLQSLREQQSIGQ